MKEKVKFNTLLGAGGAEKVNEDFLHPSKGHASQGHKRESGDSSESNSDLKVGESHDGGTAARKGLPLSQMIRKTSLDGSTQDRALNGGSIGKLNSQMIRDQVSRQVIFVAPCDTTKHISDVSKSEFDTCYALSRFVKTKNELQATQELRADQKIPLTARAASNAHLVGRKMSGDKPRPPSKEGRSHLEPKPSPRTKRTTSSNKLKGKYVLTEIDSSYEDEAENERSVEDNTSQPLVVFIMGPPGSGKRTQCQQIAMNPRNGFSYIDVGQMLLMEQKAKSVIGKQFAECQAVGRTLPGKVIVPLLAKAIRKKQKRAGKKRLRLFICGFPLSKDQMMCWNEMLATTVCVALKVVINCSADLCKKRLLGNARASTANVKRKFREYVDETQPLIEAIFRREQGVSARAILGDNSVLEVAEKLLSILATHALVEQRSFTIASKSGESVARPPKKTKRTPAKESEHPRNANSPRTPREHLRQENRKADKVIDRSREVTRSPRVDLTKVVKKSKGLVSPEGGAGKTGKSSSTTAQEVRVLTMENKRSSKKPPWACNQCKKSNPSKRRRCRECKAPRADGASDAKISTSPSVNYPGLLHLDVPSYRALKGGDTRTATLGISRPLPEGASLTVTFKAPASAKLLFNPASVKFTNAVSDPQEFEVAVDVRANAGVYGISYILTGSAAENFEAPKKSKITIVKEEQSVITSPKYPTIFAGQESRPISFMLSPKPQNGLTITPSGPNLLFEPNKLVYGSGNTQDPTFTVTAIEGNSGKVRISYTLSGPDADRYLAPYSNIRIKPVALVPIKVPLYPDLSPGQESPSLTMTLSRSAHIEPLAVIPSAPQLIFHPSSIIFSPGQLCSTFTVKVDPGAKLGLQPVHYQLSGTNAALFRPPSPTNVHIMVPAIIECPIYPDLSPGESSGPLPMKVTPLPPSHVVVVPSSPGLNFKPSKIKITNRTTRMPTFMVIATAEAKFGDLRIAYEVRGADASMYQTPEHGKITILEVPGIVTPIYPDLFAGETSKPLTIRLSPAPRTSVTIVPNSPSLAFTPTKLVFTNSKLVNTFTASAFSDAKDGVQQIKYSFEGPDSSRYDAMPDSSITLKSRGVISVSELAPLDIGEVSTPVTIQISPTPSAGVTIQPYGAGVLFAPSKLKFGKDKPCIANFTVSLTAEAGPGPYTVSYAISGPDAKAYVTPPDSIIRPKITGKILVPDLPTLGPGETSDKLCMLLSVNPPTSVCIIPSGPGLTFKPKKLKFTNRTNRPPTFTVTVAQDVTPGPIPLTYDIEGVDKGLFESSGLQSLLIEERGIPNDHVLYFISSWSNVRFLSITYHSVLHSTCALPNSRHTLNPGKIIVPMEYPSLSEGEESRAMTVSASPPPLDYVTIVPSAPGLIFTPAEIKLTNSKPTTTFMVKSNSDVIGSQKIIYTLHGADSAAYKAPRRSNIELIKMKGAFVVPEMPNLYVGQTSSSLLMGISKPPPTSVTICPHGDGSVLFCFRRYLPLFFSFFLSLLRFLRTCFSFHSFCLFQMIDWYLSRLRLSSPTVQFVSRPLP